MTAQMTHRLNHPTCARYGYATKVTKTTANARTPACCRCLATYPLTANTYKLYDEGYSLCQLFTLHILKSLSREYDMYLSYMALHYCRDEEVIPLSLVFYSIFLFTLCLCPPSHLCASPTHLPGAKNARIHIHIHIQRRKYTYTYMCTYTCTFTHSVVAILETQCPRQSHKASHISSAEAALTRA